MVENIVRNYLVPVLDAPVYTEEPTEKPIERVVITRTNLYERNFIQYATVMIWCYSESLYKASVLDEKVRQAMKGITSLDNVSKCQLNNSYNDTNTSKNEHRYRAEFDLVFFD